MELLDSSKIISGCDPFSVLISIEITCTSIFCLSAR